MWRRHQADWKTHKAALDLTQAAEDYNSSDLFARALISPILPTHSYLSF